MSDRFLLWDRSDYESTLLDLDTGEDEIGFVYIEGTLWRGEARGAMLPEEFRTQRDAEAAVMSIVEGEDGLL